MPALSSIRMWNLWMNWVCSKASSPYKTACRKITLARTAIGNGSVEEQLIRLMVWSGAATENGPVHSGKKYPPDILEDGRAWCDQQCKVFCFIASHLLGLHTRTIALTDITGQGHTVAEAEYDNLWHLFDVHEDHQAIYRSEFGRILSYEELRDRPDLIIAENHWWRANGIGKVEFYRHDFKYTDTAKLNWTWPWSTKP